MARILVTVLAMMLAAGCAPRGAITLDPAAARVGHVETIFVGTTRAPDPTTGEAFSAERSTETRFARLDISVPPDRRPGAIAWPRPRRAPDPATEFLTVDERSYGTAKAFRADLRAALMARRPGAREAVVFVHGFNSNFAEGAYRLAQIGDDLDLTGVLVHYSWPSRAHPLGYAYDRDSALFARDGLQALLDEVVASGAEHVLLVAHSLGSALTMEALRQMAIGGDRRAMARISGVVLLSPDIDVDVFLAQAERIGKLPEPFLIFTSKKDRALALSARLTGEAQRLGNLRDVSRLANLKVTVFDTTAFSQGLGHFDSANSPALLALLGRISEVDSAIAADAQTRVGLLPGAVLTVRSATEIVLSPVTALSGLSP